MWIPVQMLLEKKAAPEPEADVDDADSFEKKADNVPALIRHCMVAVSKKHGARGAWNICRGSMTRYGYLKGPYKEKSGAKDVKMSQKGTRRSFRHGMERDAPGKATKFLAMFRRIKSGDWAKDRRYKGTAKE